jgi:hypothetical protein
MRWGSLKSSQNGCSHHQVRASGAERRHNEQGDEKNDDLLAHDEAFLSGIGLRSMPVELARPNSPGKCGSIAS